MRNIVVFLSALVTSLAGAQTLDWSSVNGGPVVAFTGSSVTTIRENHTASPRTAIITQSNSSTGAVLFTYTNSVTMPQDYSFPALCGDGSGNTYVAINVFGPIGNSLLVQKFSKTQAAPLWSTTISSTTAQPFAVSVAGGDVFVASNVGSGATESENLLVFQASTGSQITSGTQNWSASIGTSLWTFSNATYTGAYIGGSNAGQTQFQVSADIFTSATSSWAGTTASHQQGTMNNKALAISGDSSAVYLAGWDIHIPATTPLQEGLVMKFTLNSGGVPAYSTFAQTSSSTVGIYDSAISDSAGTIYVGITGADHNRLTEYSSSLGALNTWNDTGAGEIVSGVSADASRVRMFSATPSGVATPTAHLISTNTSCSLLWDDNVSTYTPIAFSDGSSGESYVSGADLARIH